MFVRAKTVAPVIYFGEYLWFLVCGRASFIYEIVYWNVVCVLRVCVLSRGLCHAHGQRSHSVVNAVSAQSGHSFRTSQNRTDSYNKSLKQTAKQIPNKTSLIAMQIHSASRSHIVVEQRGERERECVCMCVHRQANYISRVKSSRLEFDSFSRITRTENMICLCRSFGVNL